MPNPSTNLQVSAGTGMKVNLYAGFAICNGCQKLQESNTTLDIATASAVNDRIDTVVLRLNDNDDVRECEFYVLIGEAATTPVRPALTQTDSIWEIGLADILVKANSTQISNANITDTRYETARCGIISSISEFDTTTLYQQIQADLSEFQTGTQAEISEFQTVTQAEISEFQTVTQAEVLAWFENLKEQLTDNVAVNLQNQIGDLSNLQTEDKTSLTAAVNEVKEESATASKIDNMSIQRDIQERLSVPALKRVFRGEIKINSSSSATLYIPLNADVSKMETGDDWIQEGDLFFCDVNPDGANYNCQPTTFSVIGSNEVSNSAGLYTTNYVTGGSTQKSGYSTTPYITYYTSSSENACSNKKGFTILRYRGIDSNGKMNFQDLLNGYTSYTTSTNSNTTSLATGSAVKKAYDMGDSAYYNNLSYHAYAYFQNVGTGGETINLKAGDQYLLFLVAHNASTGAIYGTTARLITTPAVSGSTANVNVLSLGATSNTGYAITAGNFAVTIKSSSSSYIVSGHIYIVNSSNG